MASASFDAEDARSSAFFQHSLPNADTELRLSPAAASQQQAAAAVCVAAASLAVLLLPRLRRPSALADPAACASGSGATPQRLFSVCLSSLHSRSSSPSSPVPCRQSSSATTGRRSCRYHRLRRRLLLPPSSRCQRPPLPPLSICTPGMTGWRRSQRRSSRTHRRPSCPRPRNPERSPAATTSASLPPQSLPVAIGPSPAVLPLSSSSVPRSSSSSFPQLPDMQRLMQSGTFPLSRIPPPLVIPPPLSRCPPLQLRRFLPPLPPLFTV